MAKKTKQGKKRTVTPGGAYFTKSVFNIPDHSDAVEINLRRIALANANLPHNLPGMRQPFCKLSGKCDRFLQGFDSPRNEEDMLTVVSARA